MVAQPECFPVPGDSLQNQNFSVNTTVKSKIFAGIQPSLIVR
jgi:hypothetical protein